METITLTLTDMAHGGDALGRDEDGRVVFVPFAVPGEKARVEIREDKGRFAHGRLLEIEQESPQRIEPRCPHFGVCGGCHWQHIDYESQLAYKREVVRDQLARIGHLEDVDVHPPPPSPEPWAYSTDVSFISTAEGELGFWSPYLDDVMPVEVCYIIREQLLELFHDIDLSLPGLRRMTLRLGDDDSMLVALEVEGVEPPQLSVDFPVSAAMVLPDGTAANLIGDNYVVKAVKGRDFRVSAGSFFYPSPTATEQLIDAVLDFAALTGKEMVLEAYCGVGALTAFLAPQAATVTAIEAAPDAVADAAFNLDGADDVALYAGTVEDVLPDLPAPDLMVVDPPTDGLPRGVVEEIVASLPARLIYISGDVATLARDGQQLDQAGYEAIAVQPIDMMPQTYHVHTVSLWEYQG